MKDNRKLLVPVDGSTVSYRAAAWAGELASRTGAAICLLFVSSMKAGQSAEQARFIPVEQLVASMQDPEEIFARARQEIPAGVPVTSCERIGRPAQEIVACGKEEGSDLIIMGSKGRKAVEGFLLGSVSQKVVENGDISVLIVK